MPLTPQQRKELIEKVQRKVLENQASAFRNIANLEKFLIKMYKKAAKDIKATVNEMASRMPEWTIGEAHKYSRLQNLLNQINQQLDALGEQEINFMQTNLQNMYVDRYLRETYLLGQYINISHSFDKLSPRMIREAVNYPWSGAMFSDRIWDNKEKLKKNLREGITQSLVLGESNYKLANRINKSIDTAMFNAMRVARTEVMRVSYVAETKAMKDNGIEKVQYLATTSDERTCHVCGDSHLKEFVMGEEIMLPRHPHCRCTYVPVVEPVDYMETNAKTQRMRDAEDYNAWREGEGIKAEGGVVKETRKRTILDEERLPIDVREKGSEIEVELLGKAYKLAMTAERAHYLKRAMAAKNKQEFEQVYFSVSGDDELDSVFMDIYKQYTDFDGLYKVGGYDVAINEVMAEEIGKRIQKWEEKPTKDEIEGIRVYTGMDYSTMNKHFRRGDPLPDRLKKNVLDLDNAFTKSAIVEDLLVQRGIDIDAFPSEIQSALYKEDFDSVKGWVFEDRGYMSTSIGTFSAFPGDVRMQIMLNKGSRAIYVADYSQSRGEYEVLLPRGTKLKVVDVRRVGRRYDLLMEVVK